MRTIIRFTPSSTFAENGFSKGDVFSVGKSNKRYLLLQLDPWFAWCCRFHWWDKYLEMWYAWRRKDANNKD